MSVWTVCVLVLKVLLVRGCGGAVLQLSHLLPPLCAPRAAVCPQTPPGAKESLLEQLLCSGKLLEEGRGEEAAGNQVIPSRREQANTTLSGLVSSFSTVSG